MRLYKYCDVGGLEIIRSSAIKVTPALELNDPFDCNPTFDTQTPDSRTALSAMILSGSKLGKYLTAGKTPTGFPSHLNPDQLKALWDQTLEKQISDPAAVQAAFANSRETLAVLCLSSLKSNALMWAHYADGHKGMVIEFEADMLVSGKNSIHATDTLFEVRYSDQRPIYSFNDRILECLRVKGKPWEHENEWRAIYLKSQFQVRIIAGKEMRLRKFPPECIRAVFLGCCMPESHVAEAKRLLAREQHEGVELFQMKIDATNFSLRAVEIPIAR